MKYMKSLKSLWEQLLSKDRRTAERLPSAGLAAYYWTGAAPAEHGIRDISSTGLYLVTDERWYPGTVVTMTLQKKPDAAQGSERSIAVQSKAVRWGTDGVGLEFVLPESNDRRRGKNPAGGGIDRKALDEFLRDFRTENGRAVVDCAVPPSNSSPETNRDEP
jgi:hypothetical protein